MLTFTYTPQNGLAMQVNDQVVMTQSGHGVIDRMLTAWERDRSTSQTPGKLLKGHDC